MFNALSSKAKRDLTVYVPMGLLMVIALLWPAVTTDYSLIERQVDKLGQWFRFISAFQQYSPFPYAVWAAQSASIILAVLLTPFFLNFQINYVRSRGEGARVIKPAGIFATLLIAFPFLYVGPQLGVPRGFSYIEYLICSSRLGLGVFAASLFIFMMHLLTYPFFWVAIRRQPTE